MKTKKNFKKINCRECGNEMQVADDAVAGICWRCVMTSVPGVEKADPSNGII